MSSWCRIELPFKLNCSNADLFSAPTQCKRIRSLRIESIAPTKPMLCNNNSLILIRWANPLSFVVCCSVSIVKRNEFAFNVFVCECARHELTVWWSGYWMRCQVRKVHITNLFGYPAHHIKSTMTTWPFHRSQSDHYKRALNIVNCYNKVDSIGVHAIKAYNRKWPQIHTLTTANNNRPTMTTATSATANK